MASREEEKRRRREERLAAEQEAAAGARRQRAIRRTAAGVVAVIAVAGIAAAIASSGGGGGGGGSGTSSGDGSAKPVRLPAAQESDLKTAAAKAGCVVRDFENFGSQHTTDKVTYKTNPPTSGPHNPQPAQDGAYAPGNPPAVGEAVHALEHGRIDLQWRPGLPARTIGQLQALFNEQGGYHALLFANQTRMPYAVAASAWQHFVGCPKITPAVFDALRDFRKMYTDKGPEKVP